MRDRIYSAPGADLVDFVFDERVAQVFPDMIRRSVPGYELIVAMTGLLAARHAQPNGRCYDLGCSLGATSLSMQKQVSTAGVHIVGVDTAPAMISEARRIAGPTPDDMPPIEFVCADMRTAPLPSAAGANSSSIAPQGRAAHCREGGQHIAVRCRHPFGLQTRKRLLGT